MIQGIKLQLTPRRRAVKTGTDPETGAEVVLETAEELHLFMVPGGYCKHTDGVWCVQPPPRNSPVYRLVTEDRKVEEHTDGTITVSGIFETPGANFRLDKGNWIEVPIKAAKTEGK